MEASNERPGTRRLVFRLHRSKVSVGDWTSQERSEDFERPRRLVKPARARSPVADFPLGPELGLVRRS